MRTALETLRMATVLWPPPKGTRHGLNFAEDRLILVLVRSNPSTDPEAKPLEFLTFALEEADLDLTPTQLLAAIGDLLAPIPVV